MMKLKDIEISSPKEGIVLIDATPNEFDAFKLLISLDNLKNCRDFCKYFSDKIMIRIWTEKELERVPFDSEKVLEMVIPQKELWKMVLEEVEKILEKPEFSGRPYELKPLRKSKSLLSWFQNEKVFD